MRPETRRRLLDAREAAVEVRGFLAGKTLDNLRNDRMLLLAVLKLLSIVGEALNKARKRDREAESLVPRLRRWVNLRNQIVHDYDKVDTAIIWEVANEGVPGLLESLDRVLGGRTERRLQGDGQQRAPETGERRPARQRG